MFQDDIQFLFKEKGALFFLPTQVLPSQNSVIWGCSCDKGVIVTIVVLNLIYYTWLTELTITDISMGGRGVRS